MFDPKLKEALGRVQKPGRYTGGEPGSVYKDKEKVDVRFAFCWAGWPAPLAWSLDTPASLSLTSRWASRVS